MSRWRRLSDWQKAQICFGFAAFWAAVSIFALVMGILMHGWG